MEFKSSWRRESAGRSLRRLLVAAVIVCGASPSAFTPRAAAQSQSGKRTLLSSPAPSRAGGAKTTGRGTKAGGRRRGGRRRSLSGTLSGWLRSSRRMTESLMATTVDPSSAGAGAEQKIREEPKWRLNWFLFQRSYPNESLPSRARAAAFVDFSPQTPGATPQPTPTPPGRWRPIGPAPITPRYTSMGVTSGRVSAVTVSPADPQLVLVGGATGGIWRSTDGGNTFAPTTDDHVDLAVGSIAFAPSNPLIVYAGMGDVAGGYMGTGVLKSTDGGQTWARLKATNLPSPGTIANIVVDPTDPKRLYVAQYTFRAATGEGETYASGLFISEDGGETWRKRRTGLPRDLVHHSTRHQTLYLAMATTFSDSPPSAGVYKSTDGGKQWTAVFKPSYLRASDVKIAVTPAEPENLYVFTGDGEGAEGITLHVSKDGGTSWSTLNHGDLDLGQFGYNSFVAADPGNANNLYVGTRDLFKSADGGRTWANLTKNWEKVGPKYEFSPEQALSHTDQHAIAFSPNDPRVIYLGNDGGLSRSADGGATFRSLNATLSLTQFNSITLHPADAQRSCGGTQDNGALVRPPGLPQWTEFISGDSGRCLMNPADPSMMYSSYIFGTVYRTRNHGTVFAGEIANEFTFSESPEAPRIGFYPAFAVNPANGKLYFGTWRLFVSADQGINWEDPSDGKDLTKGETSFGADVLTTIGVGPAGTDVLYTGSAQGRVMVTKDGGASWDDITRGLPRRFITSIVVDPADADKVYVTVSGFGTGHIFRSLNGGGAWQNISAGIDNIPVNAFLIDPLRSQTLYAGTDVGVYVSQDDGGTWHRFNVGLPPVIVTGFSSQPSSGAVQLSTYGRGAYELVR